MSIQIARLTLPLLMMFSTLCNGNMELANNALQTENYAQARIYYSELKGPRARFGEGVACYRLKDFSCAKAAFAEAAWLTNSVDERARAIFNLGNSAFFLGEFQQAIVLFQEASALGIASHSIAVNIAFAERLHASTEAHLDSLQRLESKALWRAARNQLETFQLDGISSQALNAVTGDVSGITAISDEDLKAILTQAVVRMVRAAGGDATEYMPNWIETETGQTPRDTAQLFNRLMPREIGLPDATTYTPKPREGHRPW